MHIFSRKSKHQPLQFYRKIQTSKNMFRTVSWFRSSAFLQMVRILSWKQWRGHLLRCFTLLFLSNCCEFYFASTVEDNLYRELPIVGTHSFSLNGLTISNSLNNTFIGDLIRESYHQINFSGERKLCVSVSQQITNNKTIGIKLVWATPLFLVGLLSFQFISCTFFFFKA